jgi:hypothetical protein
MSEPEQDVRPAAGAEAHADATDGGAHEADSRGGSDDGAHAVQHEHEAALVHPQDLAEHPASHGGELPAEEHAHDADGANAPVATDAVHGSAEDAELARMSSGELRGLVGRLRGEHEAQLALEARTRAEVEDMCLRIEKHFKAEKARRPRTCRASRAVPTVSESLACTPHPPWSRLVQRPVARAFAGRLT